MFTQRINLKHEASYYNTDGLVAGYDFRLNQDSDDISGNSNDGNDTNINYIGTGAVFDGSTSFITLNDFPNVTTEATIGGTFMLREDANEVKMLISKLAATTPQDYDFLFNNLKKQMGSGNVFLITSKEASKEDKNIINEIKKWNLRGILKNYLFGKKN